MYSVIRIAPRRASWRLASCLVLTVMALCLIRVGSAEATLSLLKQNPSDPATFSGHGGYSADGLGQNGTGGSVQADVPAGSTVVQANLYGTYHVLDPSLADRTIDFDGTTVELSKVADNGGFLASARADVTAQVATKVGTGGAISDFTVNSDPGSLDGVALVVIYSNPSLPETTVAVLDGNASSSGDTATFNLAAPLDTTTSGFSAVMSVGSGFSYQGSGGGHECGPQVPQYSTIDINGSRLTSCAGNYDDGAGNDGALITVGGVGDSTGDPSDPNQTAGSGDGSVTDDELYNLVPLLSQGITQISIQTTNPSGDDNLFLAVIAITAKAAVTTEVCNDGIDNDGDGLVDAADPDCQVAPPATNTAYTGDASVQYSDVASLSGTLTQASDNSPISGKQLDFVLGTQSASASPTDASGAASTSLQVLQKPGSVSDVKASFAGDSAYSGSSDTKAFSITKEDCTLAYSGDTLVPAGGQTTLAADLGELDSSLGDLSGKTVTFTVTDAANNSQTFTATTDTSGHAASTQSLPAGPYGVSVSFAGDDFYAPCEAPAASLTVEAPRPPAPRVAKRAALADLRALVPSGNREDDKRIAKAVEDIERSLDPKLWVDDSHLSLKRGEKVFQEEKEAVEHLRNIRGSVAGAVDAVIAQLVDVDRALAQTAIDEATDAKDIAKANGQMAKAATDLARGKPGEAIERYKHAWKDATKA